jgi:hypothetical protein
VALNDVVILLLPAYHSMSCGTVMVTSFTCRTGMNDRIHAARSRSPRIFGPSPEHPWPFSHAPSVRLKMQPGPNADRTLADAEVDFRPPSASKLLKRSLLLSHPTFDSGFRVFQQGPIDGAHSLDSLASVVGAIPNHVLM